MASTEDTSYPPALRRQDRRRGRRDGERRTPALAEVRDRQAELRETGGRLTVGYEVVLLAELDARLNALFPAYQRTGQAMLREIGRHEERITQALWKLDHAREHRAAAEAELTPEELRPRNLREESWDEQARRNRREVLRARRIRAAQAAVEAARHEVNQRRADCAEAKRRRDEALIKFGIRAQRLKELYQQRIATYVDALAGSHPDGRTLHPLLSIPDIPLPAWAHEALMPGEAHTRAGEQGDETETATAGAEADRDEADPAEPPAGSEGGR